MIVRCTNDSNLPPGAEIKKGEEYKVIETFFNFADQKVYKLRGIRNEGRTSFGLPWIGYRADRFSIVETDTVSVGERMVVLN